MKTTSSYSSLAFAAFFKGKKGKTAKQLRLRSGGKVQGDAANWQLSGE